MTLEDKLQEEEQKPTTAQEEAPKQNESPPTKPFPELVVDINSSIPETKLEAVRQIRQLLTQEEPPIQEVIESGALPRLVSFLGPDEEEEDLQKEVSWIVAKISSGTSEQTMAVVEAGAIPLFVNLLSSKNEDIQEQAIRALGISRSLEIVFACVTSCLSQGQCFLSLIALSIAKRCL